MKKVFLFFSAISAVLPLGLYGLIIRDEKIDFSQIMEILLLPPSPGDILPILVGVSIMGGIYPLCLFIFLLALWTQPSLKPRQKWLISALSLFLGLPCGLCFYLYLSWGFPYGESPRKKLFLAFTVMSGLINIAYLISFSIFVLSHHTDKIVSLFKSILASDRAAILMLHAFGFSVFYLCLLSIPLFLAAWRHQKLNYNQKSLIALFTIIIGPSGGLSYYFYTAQE